MKNDWTKPEQIWILSETNHDGMTDCGCGLKWKWFRLFRDRDTAFRLAKNLHDPKTIFKCKKTENGGLQVWYDFLICVEVEPVGIMDDIHETYTDIYERGLLWDNWPKEHRLDDPEYDMRRRL